MIPGGREADPLARWVRDLVRAGRWHRRLLAAGLLAGAMAMALHSLAPPPPPSVVVVTAARDVPAGSRLTEADLTVARLTPSSVPVGAVEQVGEARGRTVVSAVRRGEPLTDVRLVGAAAVDELGQGMVATPVRIADGDSVDLLRPGDVVDVLGAAGAVEAGGSLRADARLLASAVRVVTVPRPSGRGFAAGADGALVLLATTSTTAARLAGAAVTERLTVVLRGQ